METFFHALYFIDDKKKIIPCARDNHGISYNLKGYSVLNQARSGKLFNFWERLSFILEDGRVSIDQRPVKVLKSCFEIDQKDDRSNSTAGILKKIKQKVKKILVREKE